MSELALKAGVAKSSLSRYKSGQRDFPINDVGKFADVLNVSVEHLLGINADPKTNTYKYAPIDVAAGKPETIDSHTHFEEIELPDSVMGKWAGQNDIVIAKIADVSVSTIRDG